MIDITFRLGRYGYSLRFWQRDFCMECLVLAAAAVCWRSADQPTYMARLSWWPDRYGANNNCLELAAQTRTVRHTWQLRGPVSHQKLYCGGTIGSKSASDKPTSVTK